MLKQASRSYFRVVKRSANPGKHIIKVQNGASDRNVVSVNRGTYKRGVEAASKLVKEKA